MNWTLILGSLSLLSVATANAQSNYEPYLISTFSGNTAPAHLSFAQGVAVDSAGNVYIADTSNHTIRKTNPDSVVSTLAGSAGSTGTADGTGAAARFNSPQAVAADKAGNIYVADTGNHTIRKITASGVVSTLAGSAGVSGSADGTGNAARFSSPQGVAVDSAGYVYVADTFNETVRKITPAGVVTTLAGSPGNLGSSDGTGNAARFYFPIGVAVDGSGNVFVGDTNNNTIRKVTPTGIVTTLAGAAGLSGSSDGLGNSARFYSPRGIAVDGAGNVYVGDYGNNTVRTVTPTGAVTTLAGLAGTVGSNDGTGSDARFNSPVGVALDSATNVFVADSGNHTVRQISPGGVVTTWAGSAGISGSNEGAGDAARFSFPSSIAADAAGNVYVGDSGHRAIRKLDGSGIVTTLAKGISGGGLAVGRDGTVYATENNAVFKVTPQGVVSTLAGLPGTSGSADGTGSAARFNGPAGIAVDDAGYTYVAEFGNRTVRKISPTGEVITLAGLAGSAGTSDGKGSAARFTYPRGLALNGSGELFLADSDSYTIRKITSSGVVSTFAGLAGARGTADGTGAAARFDIPDGVAVDTAGNVYVADYGKQTIRKITPTGTVTTLAGSPGAAGNSDGTGASALFNFPKSVAVDNQAILYIADSVNNTIRRGISTGTPPPPPKPVIRSPLVETSVIGQPFVYQFETTGATSLAVLSLPPGLTFNAKLAAITGNPAALGTFQIGLSASNLTGTTTANLTLTVQANPAAGPVITSSSGATGKVGQPFTFQVTTTGGTDTTRLSAAGLPTGLGVDPVTGIISGTPGAVGSSAVTLTATDGSLSSSSTLQLTITSDSSLPVIVSPNTALLTPGQPFRYTINTAGSSSPSDPTSYALVFNLPAGLFFDSTSGIISGTYTPFALHSSNAPAVSGGIITNVQLFATNSHGTSTLPLIFFLAPSGAVNIATRVSVGTGDNVLIAGFIITGNAPKKVVVRAIAPSLNVNGVAIPGAMQDPVLELHQATGILGTNDNWRDSQETEIIGSGIPPTDERESALLAYLSPGNYTAVVRGKNNGTGIAVVEVYDLGTASLDSSSNAKLAQISTRGTVQGGDSVMIGGFIVKQTATKVIVRAVGPSLNGIVAGALQDTILELHDGSGSTILSNDDWRSTQEQQIIDTTVPPKHDHESAIVATLNPGAYTVIVRGKGDTIGVALVEVYSLQ